MNELTPEAQAVLDAALAWGSADVGRGRELFDAVTAYRESIAPPESFTRYMWRRDEVWEVLITPVKRVQ